MNAVEIEEAISTLAEDVRCLAISEFCLDVEGLTRFVK
jgi:hypothetical protein